MHEYYANTECTYRTFLVAYGDKNKPWGDSYTLYAVPVAGDKNAHSYRQSVSRFLSPTRQAAEEKVNEIMLVIRDAYPAVAPMR